jgi:hypothetical protein
MMRQFNPLFLLLPCAFALAALAPLLGMLAHPPVPGSPMLVVAPPWLNPSMLILSAGGQVIGPRSAAIASLGQSDDPGFSERLFRLGAWAVRDAQPLGLFCGTPE